MRYRGTLTTSDGEALAVDVSSTRDGTVLASIDGGKVLLLIAAAQTYVRADQAFWRKKGAPSDSLAQYAQQWVKVPGTIFGVDLRKVLAPGLLAERLAPDIFVEADTPPPRPQISTAGTTSVNGQQVQVVRTSGLTIYLSTTEPKRIVRFAFGSPYLIANQPIDASVTINMALDGRPVKTCQLKRTMRPNANATVRCTAIYNIPPSRKPTTHTIRASARAVASGAVEADIAKMINDLKNDIKQNRIARRESGRTPSTRAPAATKLPTAPPCTEPNPGFNGGGPGAWKVLNRNGSSTALWPDYQEQVTGVKRTREYFYQGIDFDGYVNEGGNHVFLEAKGRGRAGHLRDPEDRVAELDARTKQLRGQLEAISKTPGAKLRYVAAEADFLDAVRKHVKSQLPADLYNKIDWKHQPHDFRLKGCI